MIPFPSNIRYFLPKGEVARLLTLWWQVTAAKAVLEAKEANKNVGG